MENTYLDMYFDLFARYLISYEQWPSNVTGHALKQVFTDVFQCDIDIEETKDVAFVKMVRINFTTFKDMPEGRKRIGWAVGFNKEYAAYQWDLNEHVVQGYFTFYLQTFPHEMMQIKLRLRDYLTAAHL